MPRDSTERAVTTTRRRLLGTIGAGVGVATLGTVGGSAQESDDYWTVVALPDTQNYAENKTSYAKDQTEWIADNADAENIVFASHEGDLVENGDDDAEWQYIDDALSTLDGVVPYASVTGNHDYVELWDRLSGIARYKERFGPSRYAQRDWFGGAGPTNGDENRDNLNSYQLFSAGGYDFMHLALEWETPGSVDDSSTPLGWAQRVLDDHPDRATIVTTHSYLRDSPKRRGRNLQEANNIGNTGQTLWEELISPNEQVFMVLCGHWHEDDGEVHQVSTNAADSEVYELLANYQFGVPNGGNGFMRRIEFRPGGGSDAPDRIQVRTYSPSTGDEKTDGDSKFGFDLDFDARFGSSSEEPDEPDDPSATFQQGTDGYEGAADTMLRAADPESSYGTVESLSTDGDNPQGTGYATQVLLRFDGIVGLGDSQIPPGATITEATLRLQTADAGDGAAVHRLRTGWTPESTWASVGGGIQADGLDAVSEPETETGAVETGETTVDVTTSVQAWVDGARNRGWVFRPLGSDGWDIKGVRSGTPPTLIVDYDPRDAAVGDADGDGDIDDDDVTRIQRSIAGEDVDINRTAADVDGDGDVDISDAVAVDNFAGGSQ
ncbi:DNRLRE domain-containing protein [Halobaculum halobium]|uniref:DNRLRE domain-containing protein n=1 Tax=Halobaculum halobium TaxID=3032281 RepID=A0ABD5T5P9_9EURY|nr:DNRLRE domain-containing protein [Halobaculum sp. SYNS20]